MREPESESPSHPAPTPEPASAPQQPGASTSQGDRALELPTASEPPHVDAPPAPPTPAEALQLVADASAALAGSLDLDEVLAAVGRIAVPRLADVCVLDLADDDGGPRRCVMATTFDAPTERVIREYLARYPAGRLDPRSQRLLGAGEPLLLRDLDDAHYHAVARTPEQLELLRRFHPRDVVAVPLRAQGRTLGVMSLISTGPRPPDEATIALARELAHRVAQAVLNARLYAAARRSEARLALALEGAAQGLWDWDLRTGHLWLDRQLCAMLGRTPEEFGGDPDALYAVVHPADVPRVRQAMRDHREGRAPAFESEHRMRHADGTWRWVLSRGRVVERDAAGRPVRIAGTHTDVTERRHAAEAREVLARTVEASGDVVKIFDRDGRLTYMNPAGLRLLGAPDLDAVRGWPLRDLLVDAERGRVEQGWRALFDAPGAWKGECHLRPIDGRPPVHIEAYAFAVREPDTGEVAAVACVARDLTERDTAAAERERLAEQARHAQRIESLGVLAGGVAHDFNNLLTVILSTIDLVGADLPDEHPAQADLEVVRGAATRASQLTRQLLAFSRRQVLESRVLDLNVVVTEAERLLRRLVGERATLDVSLAAHRLPVLGDAVQLEQVLVNLVLNARDAVAERVARGDDAPPVITVETREHTIAEDVAALVGVPAGRYAILVVRDTGIGMDETTRQHVFEPFFTTKPLGQGTGLGLAMVYGIVTQSGGTVRVESAPGHGSAFHVLLPRAAEEGAERAAPSERPAPQWHGRETVLLVEDETAVRAVARRILERAGYTVFEARHGADALLVWREQGGAHGTIDVLLTDMRMPELGGRELADALRRERPDLPVVFFSGYAEPEPRLHIADAAPAPGAGERFVPKPFVAPDLQRALRQVLDAPRHAA